MNDLDLIISRYHQLGTEAQWNLERAIRLAYRLGEGDSSMDIAAGAAVITAHLDLVRTCRAEADRLHSEHDL